jgi:hypothetical protein
MNDHDWQALIRRIEDGRCTPFLGSGASVPKIPTGRELARRWADTSGYPLDDAEDLARVAQYVAVRSAPDMIRPKEDLEQELREVEPPDFDDPNEIHALLAELPLPLYLTTNYDDFMLQALRRRTPSARQEICQWNEEPAVLQEPAPLADDPSYRPTPEEPLVFHLHGRVGVPESMVLIEDDYLDFLIALSERRDSVLPHQIRRALSSTTLLFIGYSLEDWNFRVLHRGLVAHGNQSLRRASVTVQLDKDKTDEAKDYLRAYFENMRVTVFWGDAAGFGTELRQRWEER